MTRSFVVLLLLILTSLGSGGCKEGAGDTGDSQEADGSSQADGEVALSIDSGLRDAANEAVPLGIIDTGPQHVAACESFSSSCAGFTEPNCGRCQYRIRYNGQHCSPTKPCDNLFMLWTASTCEGDKIQEGLDQILEGNTDFVTVCVAPQVPGQMLPISLGAPGRENALIPHVLDRLRDTSDLGVWSGKNLLMGGCSAGASRYPVVAARYPDDSDWLGSEKTGACFSDGVVSISFQDNFTGGKIGVGKSCASRHGRVVRAYTRDSPLVGHACSGSPQGQCPCDPGHTFRVYPGSCADGDCVDFDSIIVQQGSGLGFNTGVTAGSFAVKHWKLLSEGSSWEDADERCENDVCPEAPFKTLCAGIDADPEHSCTFVQKPDHKHCSFYFQDLNASCVSWFRGL